MRTLKCVFKQLNDITLTPKHEAAYRGQFISSERMNRHTHTHTHARTHARTKYSNVSWNYFDGKFFHKKGEKMLLLLSVSFNFYQK